MASSPSCIRHCRLLSLLLLVALSPYSATSAKLSYADHCDSVVPRAAPAGNSVNSNTRISLSDGFLSGGDKLLAPDEHSSSPSTGGFHFYSQNFYPTKTLGVLKFEGELSLRGPTTSRRLNQSSGFRHGFAVSYRNRKTVSLALTGYWSKPLGKICMVGSGYVYTDKGTTLKPTAVFKLNYPQISNITTSLVNGSVESLDAPDSPAYFEPLSLLAFSQYNYTYTKIPQAKSACGHVNVLKEVLGFGDGDGASASACNNLFNMRHVWFRLEHGHTCSVLDCGLLGFTPTFMAWQMGGCEDGKVRMSITFTRDNNYESLNTMEPEKSMVAEGAWDPEKNRLCLLANPIKIQKNSVMDAYNGNATIAISLWFPKVLSIESSGLTEGQMWSEKAKGYKAISFRSSDTNGGYLPGTKYVYTRTDTVKKICGSIGVGNLGDGRYPDGTSVGDLKFDYSLRADEVYSRWGSAAPLSLDEHFYGYSSGFSSPILVQETTIVEEKIPVFWNVSYKLSHFLSNRSSGMRTAVDITAEGIYDAGSGRICMVGCRDQNNYAQYRKSSGYPMDCEILINIQLAPMNIGDGNAYGNASLDSTKHVNGTIQSMRKKEDPLYFEPLKMSSNNMYASEAIQSIWRMDIEIIMVLVSKTLSCIFIGLQLFYIKKHPEVASSISIAMLIILTLGHVIPLLLNFEALFFMNTNKQNVLLWSGGWIEANEVIVRILTMLTFLLQLRFLQLAWNARSSHDNKRSMWVAERKALGFYLPLYFAGALIAWLVHSRSYRAQSDIRNFDAPRNYSIWQDLTAYAGLLLDGFLLPQIILNMIQNCTEKALSPLYYVGITIVRAFPHLYNAYRTRHYVPPIDSSIIYASPHEDLYSSAWDIIIPLGGVIFAVLIFFQQKLGGGCLLPKRFKSVDGYELVTVASF